MEELQSVGVTLEPLLVSVSHLQWPSLHEKAGAFVRSKKAIVHASRELTNALYPLRSFYWKEKHPKS